MPNLTSLRRNVWTVLAVCMVLAGSAAAFWGAKINARNSSDSSHQQFFNSSQQIASSLKLSLSNEQNLAVNVGAFFIENPTATQAGFLKWLAATQTFARYPELAGVAEVVIVTRAQLPAFEKAVESSPDGTLGPGKTFQIEPAGNRPFYCFTRVSESHHGPSLLPVGLDYCETILGPFFLKARDTGAGAYLPYGTGKLEELAIGTPVYSTGFVPATESERKADFIGMTGSQVYPSIILASALEHHPKTAVAFTYHKGSFKVTFRSGTVPAHARTMTIALDSGWRIKTYAKLIGASVFDSADSMALLFTGVLISLLLGALTLLLATGRKRALVMVEERTDQLQYQAMHDSLTGLPNRALILDRIEQMLSRTRRENIAMAVLFLDLDNFKDINDTLGHAAGDQLLIKVADRLTQVLRKADSVGRLGGDEFVILAEGPSLESGAEVVAARILQAFSSNFTIDASDVPLRVAASIGIAEGLRDSPGDLLRDADIALYQAKSAGKHCAVVFLPSMQKIVDEHRTLAVDLTHSMELHQFFLLYEPIINLVTGAFTGVEALLRWRHPTRGVILPEEFMPSLEASGLIIAVGVWALRETCRQGAEWQSAGHQFSIAIEVTPKQLGRDRIIDEVRAALAESHINPSCLILEIGETSLVHDVEATILRLEALKELGVTLAVDDFGTWYSSLKYLKRFPIDILKIDRRFVTRITDTEEATALVRTLVQLGIALGLETIAEGIENHEQRRLLVDENVETGQGFLFAEPLSAAQVDKFLLEWTVDSEK